MHVVNVVIEVHEGSLDEFSRHVLQHAKNSLTNEEGCEQFQVAKDTDNECRFILHEVYRDEAAFVIHQQSDHMAQFRTWINGMVKEKQLLQGTVL